MANADPNLMPAVNEVPIKNSPSVFCSHCIHFSSVVSMFVMAETELIVFLKSRTLPNLNVSTHSYTFFCALLCSPYCAGILLYTVGSNFATVRFTTIHFYDTFRVGPSTPDFWCVTVATQASFLYTVCFWLFSGVHVFLLFLF